MTQKDQVPAAAEAGIDRLAATIRAQVREFVDGLLQATAADRAAAVLDARETAYAETAERAAAEIAKVRAEAAAATEQARDEVAEEWSAELERARSEAAAEVTRLRNDMAERRSAEVERARSEVAVEVGRVRNEMTERWSAELERARTEAAERTSVEVARARAEAAERWSAEIERVQSEAAAAREQAEQRSRAEAGRLSSELEERLSRELSRASEQFERRLSNAVDSARTEATGVAEAEVSRAHAEERQAELAAIDRLLQTMRRLDEARALSDILGMVADAIAVEATRVAILVVDGLRVHGWRLMGFGPDVPDAQQIDLYASEAGVVGRAVVTGETCFVQSAASGEPARHVLSFAPLPENRVGLAVPVRVGGKIVAVVYADDASEGELPVPAPWPELVEILVRHAARSLEAMTALKASQAVAFAEVEPSPAERAESRRPIAGDGQDAARRYARLLVSEIKLYNEAAVRIGRQRRDLLQRLRSEIDQARRLYEERVAPTIPGRRAYFDQELIRTLADGDPSLLGAGAEYR
ncbi:MAG: hypothetical protein HYX76_05840 [Acidobacteria bacterium]|nr:hypothetical protein [Acidobacteriota bacterium]